MQFEENNYALWWLSMDSKLCIKQAKGCLILPSLVTEFNKVYEKPATHLPTILSYFYTL